MDLDYLFSKPLDVVKYQLNHDFNRLVMENEFKHNKVLTAEQRIIAKIRFLDDIMALAQAPNLKCLIWGMQAEENAKRIELLRNKVN